MTDNMYSSVVTLLSTLEFLCSYVGLYMECHQGHVDPLEVVLSQTNSTSAAGWIRKSNFDADTQPIQLEITGAVACSGDIGDGWWLCLIQPVVSGIQECCVGLPLFGY
jgi:hypothetical protein